MNLKNILLLLSIFISINAYSQIGVKIGGGISKTQANEQKYIFSGFIGGTYDLSLSNKWYLQPAILFSNMGFSLKDDGIIIKGGSVNTYGIEVPINISYRPNLTKKSKFILDIGIWGYYGIFGKKIYNYYDFNNINDNPFDAYYRFNLGVNLGAGMSLDNYYVIATYQRSLTYFDKSKSDYLNIFNLGIGYRFK